MMLQIDPGDPTPVYEQIRSQIRLMISARTLAPGTRLPTIRQLTSDLGVARGVSPDEAIRYFQSAWEIVSERAA
jgi:DNA-binding transcriptional regulator YhcF (GntR family)